MKRLAFVALAAVVLAGCQDATQPDEKGQPEFARRGIPGPPDNRGRPDNPGPPGLTRTVFTGTCVFGIPSGFGFPMTGAIITDPSISITNPPMFYAYALLADNDPLLLFAEDRGGAVHRGWEGDCGMSAGRYIHSADASVRIS